MAITKVSALTAKTTPTGSEEVLINDGGTSKKITIANLPDTDTTYSNFAGTTAGLVPTSTTGDDTKFLRADGTWVVPTDTDTTYSTATATTEGLVKIEDNAAQTVAANAVTTTDSRTYGVQLNASDQAVVNVPWTDTDTGITDVVDDTTPQLGGDLDCNGAQIQWSKGADVASATALPVLTDGNYFDVTGTTTVTSINTTGGAGTLIKLHFDAILILTHHATDLILPSGANITTAAGDEAEFIEYATGDYRCTNYSKADGTSVVAAAGGKVLQVVSVRSTSSTAVSGTYPGDIPHADTGLSLAITPTESDSDILILVVQSAKYDTGSETFDISVHRDSTALNISSGNSVGFGPIVSSFDVGLYQRGQQSLQYFDTGRSAGTSAITYKTRGGPYRTGTVTFQSDGFQSTMILMEISV